MTTTPPPQRTIQLDDHHKKIVDGLQEAERQIAEALGAVSQAEKSLAEARGRRQYYQGQLDLLAQFAQHALVQPADEPEGADGAR
jgi:F0F1-type ATP synthase membrane subunit b/b'